MSTATVVKSVVATPILSAVGVFKTAGATVPYCLTLSSAIVLESAASEALASKQAAPPETAVAAQPPTALNCAPLTAMPSVALRLPSVVQLSQCLLIKA